MQPESKSASLVGLMFLQGQWSTERGTILAQVAPDHYLVRSLNGMDDKSAKVVGVGDMKHWRFFENEAELEEWVATHFEAPNDTREARNGKPDDFVPF
jgi:hypothetical protein